MYDHLKLFKKVLRDIEFGHQFIVLIGQDWEEQEQGKHIIEQKLCAYHSKVIHCHDLGWKDHKLPKLKKINIEIPKNQYHFQKFPWKINSDIV